jgi:hypothetical protein
MEPEKLYKAEELQLRIDHRNCKLQLSTPAGPARLAVIDCNGNILPVENVERLMVDAACDAMFDFIQPSLDKHVRHLKPPKPL